MSSNPALPADNPPETWLGVAAGLLIFLVAGLVLILGEIPRESSLSLRLKEFYMLAFWGFLLIPPLGFTLGWIGGFRRWSYPYTTLAALLALYIANASTPGLTIFGYTIFGRQLWGLRAFIPLLIGSGIAWLVTRSFEPLGRYFSRIGQDWTLGSYALSGTLPLVIMIAYDEMDRLYSLRDMCILTGMMHLMALFYLRSRTPRQRRLSVGVGIPLILAYTVVSTTLFWQSLGSGNVFIPGMLIWLLILVAFYLSPGIIFTLRSASLSANRRA